MATETKSKHTAGPWRVANPQTGCVTRDDETFVMVASVYGDDPDCLPDERLAANARLIAAAPEMLALLRELIDIEGPCPGNRGWAEKVRATIARAEG